MNHIFITYGDKGYEKVKKKITEEAMLLGEFSYVYSYGREDLSKYLLSSKIINISRGGGLWSWKPDVILSTMNKHKNGDIIVYCDAGCSLYKSKEWKKYLRKLEKYEIIAQRIFQRTDKWTRKELIEHFDCNKRNWTRCYQYQATIIIIMISDFTRKFIKEWRDLMIEHPEFAMDVTEEEKYYQQPTFFENRHDQAIYSSLIYKYLTLSDSKDKIFTQWEHIEDYDLFCKQAIRATRLRQGQAESTPRLLICTLKRLIKDYLFKPFYYQPLQWWHSK